MTNIKTPRFLPILLAFCMFSTGASGLVNEYVLATMTTYILGNSIEQFSLVIAAMMLMMGVSGLVQGKLSDENLMAKFLGIEVFMAVLGGFAPLLIYAAYAYSESYFYIIHYSLVLAIGFLIGFEIPIVMRIIDQYQINLKKNLALVYGLDYIGAFIGAIVWVKFLLKNFPLTEISFIVAGFNFIVATIAVLYFIRHKLISNPVVAIILIIITSSALVYGFSQNRDMSNLLEQRFYEDPIVHKITTKYQHLVVTENKTTEDVRLYINGNTQFSSLDEKRYHDLLVHPSMVLNPRGKHVLVLGGGDGLALREVLKYPRIESITLVDLDPGMVKLSSTEPHLTELNKGAFNDVRVHLKPPRNLNISDVDSVYLNNGDMNEASEWVAMVNVFHVDADQFIRNPKGIKWDTVIIDFPDPSSVELSKLYSKRFYQRLKQHLNKDAVIAVQSTSPYHAKEAYLSIGRTLSASGYKILPYRMNIPSFGDWGFYLAWTQDVSTQTMKQQLKNINQFEVETDFITPELMVSSFAFGKNELSSQQTCINTIMFPCLLTHYVDYSWQID